MNPPHNPPPPPITASRPPPPSRIPPPPRQPDLHQQHQTTAEVDDAIARRRAELRRLKAKSSAPRPLPGQAGTNAPGYTPSRYQSNTPVIAPSARDTPSTAAVARRLDNSYGPPVSQQQPEPPQTKPDLNNYKRTSEIFPRSTTGATPVAARTRSSRTVPLTATESPVLTSSSPHMAVTRSPFGAARATLVPALPVGDKNVLVPPLILEPAAKSNEKPPIKRNVMQGDKQNVVKEGETKDLKETLTQIVDSASGASTPVTSNSLSTEKILQSANKALLNAKKEQTQNTVDIKRKSTPPDASKYPNISASPSMKPQRSKSTPSLMDQLNRAVALKGEKAVMSLLEKVEKTMSSSPYNPPLTPRGRSMDLLSSMGAPLTPRSRPSSPERWNNAAAPNEKKVRSTPLPKGDKLEIKYIIDAAMIISNEYETELVNYIVRAPGCKQKFNYDFFSSEESYRDMFDIDNSESIEILALIEADGSVFALVGKDACHGKLAGDQESETEWSVYKNIEESERALPSTTYIDMEGNEREYWLESIYDEAMSIREAYCTSIRSAACALKHAAKNATASSNQRINQSAPLASKPPLMPAHGIDSPSPPMPNQFVPPGIHPSQPKPMVPSGEEEMAKSREINQVPKEQATPQQPKEGKPPTKQADPAEAPAPEQKQKKPKEQPEQYESADSALPLMIVSLFSMFFSMVWFIFFKLPYRVCSTVLTFCIVLMCMRVLWLLLADDNGAWDMGAGPDFQYNAPGIY